MEVISFVEKTNDFGNVDTLITIKSDKVNIKRSGKLSMNKQLMEGKKTECLYRHPYGSFLLEIRTKSIKHDPIRDGEGKVVIQYDMMMNREESRYHHLTLTYMEENKE